LKRYVLVAQAKIMMNKMRKIEKGFRIRTISFAKRGRYFWHSSPTPSGMIRAITYSDILEYGTAISALEKMWSPRVNNQNGNIAETRNKIKFD